MREEQCILYINQWLHDNRRKHKEKRDKHISKVVQQRKLVAERKKLEYLTCEQLSAISKGYDIKALCKQIGLSYRKYLYYINKLRQLNTVPQPLN